MFDYLPHAGIGALLLTIVGLVTAGIDALGGFVSRRQPNLPPNVMSQLTVTVLVPAHNEASTIAATVEGCWRSTYPVAEVIVVADACTDGTASIARSAGATVHETDCADKAGAQNAVLDRIQTDLVVGFDGDTVPDPVCIERMIARMENNGLDAACAMVLPIQHRGFFIRARRYAYALGRRWWRNMQSHVGRIQVLTGGCYTFRTHAIKAIGGFPSVGISSDMDATWSLHGAGYSLAYVGEAVAYTVDPETFDQYRKQMNRWSSGFFQTMAKHRRQLGHPRALLVVGSGLFDLVTLPVAYIMVMPTAIRHPEVLYIYGLWALLRTTVTTILVATVVGPREALLGVVPNTLVHFYNKYLYLKAFVREWVLDSHWTAWTGRHGRQKAVTPVRPARVAAVVGCVMFAVFAWIGLIGMELPRLWLWMLLFLVIPWLAMFSVPAQARKPAARSLGAGAPDFCDEFSCGCAKSCTRDVVAD